MGVFVHVNSYFGLILKLIHTRLISTFLNLQLDRHDTSNGYFKHSKIIKNLS
ncbi:hypothetical protein NMY3_03088 [Candidatus Nitrosocosmicus oleophilus]|uniref:Uncharacterized protein n=1 Tax=Candidatus Nitrosocosmicus oleophilus TaxID=1353260 RepID=A0A654M1D7_9ARCH|nr:hypothetical protein NMY3_03088 [Candidatus Nitrosocosmicus oleophilus]